MLESVSSWFCRPISSAISGTRRESTWLSCTLDALRRLSAGDGAGSPTAFAEWMNVKKVRRITGLQLRKRLRNSGGITGHSAGGGNKRLRLAATNE
jgi:hypothetical protein